MRRCRNGALVEIPHPLIPSTTGCFVHAATGEDALADPMLAGRNNLEAIPESN
jgi:hypothetical protein